VTHILAKFIALRRLDLAQPTTWRARRTNFMHRVHARKAGRRAATTAFVSAPEPRTIGNVSRGKQLISGKFLFSGFLVEDADLSIWDIAADNPIVSDEIHGCTWLDDLAAVGTEKARLQAQAWVFDWIIRYGKGSGPGWTPDAVGRRLIRLINHGLFLLRGQEKTASAQFFQSLGRQCNFLSRRWKTAPPGLPRFEALAGTIHAGLSLKGMDAPVNQAVATLAKDCETHIDADGSIATRNPEELLEILSLLNWTIQALTENNRPVPAAFLDAVARIVPTLRALRHADGGLARFHGGGLGADGQLDSALVASGIKNLSKHPLHMGFLRLTGGRTTLIVDADSPPSGAASAGAHASTLGLELTSGRRPIIVNCGAGQQFGDEWRRASRATPSHTTLGIEGFSSSTLAPATTVGGPELLSDTPTQVLCNTTLADGFRKAELSHNGYQPSHGLTHGRILRMSVDGRNLEGEDILAALDKTDESVLDQAVGQTAMQGIPFTIRFHLHPDVEPTLDMGKTAVGLTLNSGEVWVFRHDGTVEMSLAPSVYLEIGFDRLNHWGPHDRPCTTTPRAAFCI